MHFAISPFSRKTRIRARQRVLSFHHTVREMFDFVVDPAVDATNVDACLEALAESAAARELRLARGARGGSARRANNTVYIS